MARLQMGWKGIQRDREQGCQCSMLAKTAGSSCSWLQRLPEAMLSCNEMRSCSDFLHAHSPGLPERHQRRLHAAPAGQHPRSCPAVTRYDLYMLNRLVLMLCSICTGRRVALLTRCCLGRAQLCTKKDWMFPRYLEVLHSLPCRPSAELICYLQPGNDRVSAAGSPWRYEPNSLLSAMLSGSDAQWQPASSGGVPQRVSCCAELLQKPVARIPQLWGMP